MATLVARGERPGAPGTSAASELARGWKIVVVSAIGVGVGLGGIPFFTLGVFLKPLTEAFAWSRAEVAATSLCLSIGSGLTAPVIGRLVDRLDVRRVALVSLAAMTVAYLALTQLRGDIRLLYLGVVMLALCGCGTSPLVWALTVSSWFDRARGRALGLTMAGSGVAAILAPRLVDRLIEAYGWQGGYVGLALFTGLVALPIVFLLFEGKRPRVAAGAGAPLEPPGMTVGAALGSQRFWQLAAGVLLVNGAVGAILVHLVALLTDTGMTRASATGIAGLLGVAVLIGRLGVGFLLDRFAAARVAAIVLTAPAIGFELLAALPRTDGLAIATALMFGVASGAEVDLLAYLTGRLFGLRAFGAIYGLLLVAFLLGGGVGPILMGHIHDVRGDYGPALTAGGVICFAGALLMGTLGRFANFASDAPPADVAKRPGSRRPSA
jgi:predicted MFS family arabinose efflux permease